jgi:hypothetical protein
MSRNQNIQHGKEKDFEHDDPMELRAVAMPGGSEEAQARAFIEEFLFLGTTKSELIEIFKNPFYSGAFLLYEKFGEEKIVSLIDEYFTKQKK